LLRRRGANRIYLVGHSTGCQKIAYYLGRRGNRRHVTGAVLLCPISDYASATYEDERRRKKAESAARKLVRQGKPSELLPARAWRGPIDAQRFLSLYTPDSEEEIFTYAQPRKIPHALRRVKSPALVVFAGDDEYRDRATEEIAGWFCKNLRSNRSEIQIVPGALHSFSGQEAAVARIIRGWIARRNSVGPGLRDSV
ncbi:MAG: alpha/beta fold hydrolase, partial [Acidobacteriota bacterium]|nr:alpha/beta fold hydrolase [Acidobacteriota bacterium]